MTLYTFIVQQSNIDQLPTGYKLTYDDKELPEYTSIHVAYFRIIDRENSHQTYLMAIPHHIGKRDILAQTHHYLQSRGQQSTLPGSAIAQQSNSQWDALILESPGIPLGELIRDEQRINLGAAENTAIKAWVQLLDLINTLPPSPHNEDTQETQGDLQIRLPFINLPSLYWNTKHQVLCLPYWDAVLSCDTQSLSWILQQSAYLWYQFLCQRTALPRDIMASERWHPPYSEVTLGTMSLGLRLIVWHSLQHDLMTAGISWQETLIQMRHALEVWRKYLSLSPDNITNVTHLDELWQAYQQFNIPIDDTLKQLILDDLRLRLQSKLEDDLVEVLQTRMQAYTDNTRNDPKTDRLSDSLWMLMNHSDTQQFLDKIKLALANHEDSEARYLLRQLLVRDEAGDTLVLQEYISFFDTFTIYRQSEKHIISAFERMQRLSEREIINQDPLLMARLAQATAELVNDAIAFLQHANQHKTWQAVQQAQSARRILQYQDGYRMFIDDMRVYVPEISGWQTIDADLQTYAELRDLFLQLMQVGTHQSLQKLTQSNTEDTAKQASNILALIQKALDKGIDIGEIMEDSDAMRQQWRQLVDDAMNTLQDSTSVRDAMSSIEHQLEQNISRMGKQLEALQKKVDEDPDAINEKINKLYAELRTLQEQSNEQQSGISMNTEKVARVARLLDDVKEQFEHLSGELNRTQQHAAGVLKGYLDWFSKQQDANTTEETLEKVDELVYAMRQCPVSAYNPELHQIWLKKFQEQTERYEVLHEARAKRLRGRRRRRYLNDAEEQRQRFMVCRQEAQTKVNGFQQIYDTKEG